MLFWCVVVSIHRVIPNQNPQRGLIPAGQPAATATSPGTPSNGSAQVLIASEGLSKTFQACFQRLASYLCRNAVTLRAGRWE